MPSKMKRMKMMKVLRVLHSDSPPIAVTKEKAKELLKTGRYVEWPLKLKNGRGREMKRSGG